MTSHKPLQATPGCAFLLQFRRQWSRAADHQRWLKPSSKPDVLVNQLTGRS